MWLWLGEKLLDAVIVFGGVYWAARINGRQDRKMRLIEARSQAIGKVLLASKYMRERSKKVLSVGGALRQSFQARAAVDQFEGSVNKLYDAVYCGLQWEDGNTETLLSRLWDEADGIYMAVIGGRIVPGALDQRLERMVATEKELKDIRNASFGVNAQGS